MPARVSLGGHLPSLNHGLPTWQIILMQDLKTFAPPSPPLYKTFALPLQNPERKLAGY